LFPTSPLLDNFNRPDGGMGVNWRFQPAGFGAAGRRLAVAETGLSLWRTSDFSADQEAFVELVSLDPAVREVGVLLKASTSGDALLGGLTAGYLPATRRLVVSIVDAQGNQQALSPTMPATLAAGDQLGARVRPNGVIDLFRNGVLQGSVDAGTALLDGRGFIGVYIDYTTDEAGVTLLDNFGGGDATNLPPPAYQLRVSTSVVGQGTVQVAPSGAITCGEPVTITAVAATGWQFGGWTGDVVATDNPLVYDLTGSLTLVANFIEQGAERPYTLSVQVAGEGSVDVQPAGPYAAGQVVKVTAQPDSGSLFTGWSGAQRGNPNPLHLQITGNAQLTANFAPQFNLHLPIARQGALPGNETADTCD
jgi:hypothetical protein